MIGRVAALTLFLFGAAAAETPKGDARDSAAKPTPAFGDDHLDCPQWTDGCVVCVREEDGPACSTPGISCLPTEPQCGGGKWRPAAPPK
jgi:hypothetical protein